MSISVSDRSVEGGDGFPTLSDFGMRLYLDVIRRYRDPFLRNCLWLNWMMCWYHLEPAVRQRTWKKFHALGFCYAAHYIWQLRRDRKLPKLPMD